MKIRIALLSAAAALMLALASTPARAQDTLTVTAANITSSGQPLASGFLCFQGTDNSGTPINFEKGGSGQVTTEPICGLIVNGAITPFAIPNPQHTSPENIYYFITVSSRRPGVGPGQSVLIQYPLTNVCAQEVSSMSICSGANSYTFNFDTCVSSGSCSSSAQNVPMPFVPVPGPAGSPGSPAAWSSGTTYSAGDVISYSGALYISIAGSNLNHLPTNTMYWTAVGGSGAGAPNQNRFLIVPTTVGCGGLSNCLALNDDNSTDNCGTPLTDFISSFNSYTQLTPGLPILDLEDGGATGGAFKFGSCNITIDVDSVVILNAWINATGSGDNFFQIGDSGCTNYNSGCSTITATITAAGPLAGGFISGSGSSLTGALIHSEPWMGKVTIQNIFFYQSGTGGATAGSCSNYQIEFDTAAQPTVKDTVGDWSTGGFCGLINNPASGQGSLIFTGNLWSTDVAGSNCGSQAVVDGGYHTTIADNELYGFAIPLRLYGQGQIVSGNQFDTSGTSCTADGVSADIHMGQAGGSTAPTSWTITANDIEGAHVNYMIALAGDTSATNIGNGSAVANVADQGTPTLSASACVSSCAQVANVNMTASSASNWSSGGGGGGGGGSGGEVVSPTWSQTLSAAAAVTVAFHPSGSSLTFVQASHNSGSSTTLAQPYASSTTAGSLLLVSVWGYWGSGTPGCTVADSVSNVFVPLGFYDDGNHYGALWVVYSGAGGADTVTATCNASVVQDQIAIAEYTGQAGAPQGAVSAWSAQLSATDVECPAVPANSSDLVICTGLGQGTATAGSGFTLRVNSSVDGMVLEDATVSGSSGGGGSATVNGQNCGTCNVNAGDTSGTLAINAGNGNQLGGIDLPDVKIIPAAACPGGSPGAGWSSAVSNFAPVCRAGSNNLGAAMQAIPSTGAAAQFMVELPSDWDSSSQPYVKIFYGSGANTSGTVIWTVSSACSKEDGSVSDDPSFNAESAFSTQTMAAANRTWAQSGQLTQVTSGNGCVAGGSMIIEIAVSGSAGSAINAYQAVVTIPRLPAVQAN